MNVKILLKDYRRNKSSLKNYREELKYVKSKLNEAGAIVIDEKVGCTNLINNKIENDYIRKEQRIEELENIIVYLERCIEKAEYYISLVEEEENREILRDHFMRKVSYKDIAKKIHLSERGTSKRANTVIKKLEYIVNIGFNENH